MTDFRFLQTCRKYGPATWRGSTVARMRELIQAIVLRNGAAFETLPYAAGVFSATFRDTPLAILPAATAKAMVSFSLGYRWASQEAHPLSVLNYLLGYAIYFAKRAGRIQAAPIPQSLQVEAKNLGDTKCCVVHATAIATGLTFGTAFDFYAANGRKTGHGTQIRVALGREPRALWNSTFTYHEPRRGEGTFAAWLKRHSTGTHIVVVPQHAFAVVNGRPFDHSPIPPRKKVQFWYTVTLNG